MRTSEFTPLAPVAHGEAPLTAEAPIADGSDARAETAAAQRTLLQVQAALLSHGRSGVAATAFATELAAQFACSRVMVGFLRGASIEPMAVSHGGGDALVGEAFDDPAAAMDEAVTQACSVYLPVAAAERPRIRLAHQRWQQWLGGSVLSVPLVHAGEVVGAIGCEWPAPRDDMAQLANKIEDVLAFCGPILHLLHERELAWPRRARRALGRSWTRLRNLRDRRVQLGLGAAALALVALCVVPMDYEIAGRAHVEGAQQRALAAPADGFLKAVHARPGDSVRTGQLLLELADQDLLLEQRRWSSELAQQESAYAVAMARADRAQMVIASARADQARAQLARTQALLARAAIVAPFDGIILQGDLSQSIGAPLERGKPLLVMAPDASYRIVVDIDERDVAHVATGQRGALSLAAQPWQRLPLQVTRLTPVARAADGRNVFEVEASVNPGNTPLRPGLEGVARLVAGQQPLLWTWTHRLFDWLRLQAWTWWGCSFGRHPRTTPRDCPRTLV
ncbi:MAG: HlyD family efflux transporter periplasmic adaptor subunit [Proteobacteria bacterium]|nr:HlyD family efflux transporter periplasmic adaptor subunit [Pseudomonadota bacterium]